MTSTELADILYALAAKAPRKEGRAFLNATAAAVRSYGDTPAPACYVDCYAQFAHLIDKTF